MAFLGCLVLCFGLKAGEVPDSTRVLRFVPGDDMFYVPWNGNGEALDALLDSLRPYAPQLEAGQMYLCVSSYAPTGNDSIPSGRMGYLRNSRVKSAFITMGGLTEEMFVTDRVFSSPYEVGGKALRDVVTVMWPASIEKIAAIAGAEAAARVEAYNRGLSQPETVTTPEQPEAETAVQTETQTEPISPMETEETAQTETVTAPEQPEADTAVQTELQTEPAPPMETEETAQTETVTVPAQPEADTTVQTELQTEPAPPMETEERAQTEPVTLPEQTEAETPAGYHLSLRANLLRWATLTPDVGVEWRICPSWGILVNGSWTSWTWSDKDRRYALWEVAPEVRYYMGEKKAWYVGAMFKAGQFNYKLSGTGKQGDLIGGGITGGYQLRLNKALSLDFGLALGYLHVDMEKYAVISDVRVRRGNETKDWWGPINAGVTLVWEIF